MIFSLKIGEIWPFPTTWIKLEGTMPSKIYQRKVNMVSFTSGI